MQVPLEKKDNLRVMCMICGHISYVRELRQDQPYRLPNPAGGSWTITYHHCQCQQILIYEPGDGGDLVLLEKTELVEA